MSCYVLGAARVEILPGNVTELPAVRGTAAPQSAPGGLPWFPPQPAAEQVPSLHKKPRRALP